MTPDQLSILHRCRKTINEMLIDRGYQYNLECFDDLSQLAASSISFDDLSIVVPGHDKLSPLLVVFTDEQKVGVKTIKNFIHKIETEKIYHMIVVLKNSITSFGNRILAEVQASDNFDQKLLIELFYEKELLINITKHRLTPQHQKLDKDTKLELLSTGLTVAQLPRLLKSDPICRYYGFVRGDIVRITRQPNKTSTDKSVSYRVVV